MKALALSLSLLLAAVFGAPSAQADMRVGNYQLLVTGRYDFHTWIWAVSACAEDCVDVYSIPQPIAKAFQYRGVAHLADGRYTLRVDVPDGLRCGNVYYGPIVATRDVYSWDADTLTGTLTSSFGTGCDGAPGGAFTYPVTLVRM